MAAITLLNKENVPYGPFTREQVAEKLQAGEINLQSLAFVEGLTQWTPLGEVLAKVDAPALPVPAIQVPVVADSYAVTMQPPPHLIYAGFWQRVAAHILDNLIVSVPFVILWVIVVGLFVGLSVFTPLRHSSSSAPTPVSFAVIGTVLLLYLSLIFGRIVAVWLYHAVLESGPHQATWGKRALGLKVTSLSGQRISFGHASGRYFSTLVTNMTMGIGYLMVAFTDKKQALHDMIASTIVVKV